LGGSPVSSTLLTGDTGPGSGPGIGSEARDLIYDASGSRLLVLTKFGDLIAVDLNTNNRQRLAGCIDVSLGLRIIGMAFGAQKQLIYVSAHSFNRSKLFVVDVQKGARVVLSRDSQ